MRVEAEIPLIQGDLLQKRAFSFSVSGKLCKSRAVPRRLVLDSDQSGFLESVLAMRGRALGYSSPAAEYLLSGWHKPC
jgi:hypothetical protein